MLHELSARGRRQRIRALRFFRGALAAFLVLIAATSLSAASEPTAVAGQPAPSGSSVESASFEAVPIEAVRIGRLVEKLKASRGHITVLNVWATWCKPCLEEMPELVRFFREYRSKGVRFLSVSADHPDTLDDRVRPYVEQQSIPFAVFVVGGESPDELVQAIDPRWQGSLPATFVFDASGARRQAWYEPIQYADLSGAVDALLEDSRASGSIITPSDKGSLPPPGAAVAQMQVDSLPSFEAIAERAGTLEAAGLVFDLPEDWVEEPPLHGMR
ncbi:MAG TPA: redoxin domain-containing protein, partial [Firmicutes bacterium]|nr:redoxin domain-containing protein [Bacillota bacterium]